MTASSTKRAYSATELLALRRSASDEKVMAIQQKVNESAIRDHLARASRSSATRSASSAYASDSLRGAPQELGLPFTGPMLSEIDTNHQTLRPPLFAKASPTPSMKKKKAEQILQQHSSPPRMRVTAGGRIVPSEHSPLCSPRYGYSAIQRNGGLIKFAPGYPPPPKTFPNFAKSLPNGFVAQDPSGRLCQMVDGRFLQIPDINGIPQLFITAPNVTNLAWGQFHSSNPSPTTEAKREEPSRSDTTRDTPAPSTAAQVAALEKHYDKLEQERRSLDKAEVLRRNELTGKAYSQLIHKRRELVNGQDELRRSIKTLVDGQSAAGSAADARSTRSSPEAPLPTYAMPAQFPRVAQWGEDVTMEHQHPGSVGPQNPHEHPVFHPQLYFPGAFPPFLSMQPFVQPMPVNNTGGRAGAHMAANVPVAPQEKAAAAFQKEKKESRPIPQPTATKSSLNPMSPIYEPSGSKFPTPQKVPTGPAKMSQPVQRQAKARRSEESVLQSSDSSFATTDFFPNNPREHSLHPAQYPAVASTENKVATTSTSTMLRTDSDTALSHPEKERHNVNWNPTIPDEAFNKMPAPDEGDVERDLATVQSQTKQILPMMSPPEREDEYTKGFRAGLHKLPISSSNKQFIAGYCSGLMQSASIQDEAESVLGNTPPARPVVRLPGAVAGADRASQSASKTTLPRLELPDTGINAFREAIADPGNEAAILSPDPEGPSVDSLSNRSLGAWAKRKVAHSSDENLRVHPAAHAYSQTVVHAGPSSKVMPTFHPDTVLGSDRSPPSASALDADYRTFSASTQPAENSATLLPPRGYPAFRVLSQPGMDFKSSTSMSHVAGMATGYFAQIDGAASKAIARHATPPQVSPASPRDNPAAVGASAPTVVSPPNSPKKSVSPAKAKFAAIAGKAGIKVRAERKDEGMEPMSPQERRRWRDVWKKRNQGDQQQGA